MFLSERDDQLRGMLFELREQLLEQKSANTRLREQLGECFQRQVEGEALIQAVSMQNMRMIEDMSVQLDSTRAQCERMRAAAGSVSMPPDMPSATSSSSIHHHVTVGDMGDIRLLVRDSYLCTTFLPQLIALHLLKDSTAVDNSFRNRASTQTSE